MTEAIIPFTVAVKDSVLTDLYDRLRKSRWPDFYPDAGWSMGADVRYVRELAAYWCNEYDWRAHEAEFNSFPQFLTRIDGQPIHSLHIRSRHNSATPLLLIHGWPGSQVEFLDLIGPLTDPVQHGGQASDAFHVVVPALPGYAFSSPNTDRGWNQQRAADAFAVLMRRLGYSRYLVQGGDWGAVVADQMAVRHPQDIIGIHSNMPLGTPSVDGAPLSASDQAELTTMQAWSLEEGAYATLQGTKPQTIGVALQDSPAALLTWMVEKFQSWSDYGLDRKISRDRLLTNIMLYWVTETATSAARFYYEFFHILGGPFDASTGMKLPGRITAPTAVARFPKEILRLPRSWVERRYNVIQWTEMPSGGHFAAMEEPMLLVNDIRTFARQLFRFSNASVGA